MLILAIVIYVVLALLMGPLWPLQMTGKGGFIGWAIVVGWLVLLLGGLGH